MSVLGRTPAWLHLCDEIGGPSFVAAVARWVHPSFDLLHRRCSVFLQHQRIQGEPGLCVRAAAFAHELNILLAFLDREGKFKSRPGIPGWNSYWAWPAGQPDSNSVGRGADIPAVIRETNLRPQAV